MSEREMNVPEASSASTPPALQVPATPFSAVQSSALQSVSNEEGQVMALGVLELREERATVEREQVSAGSVSVRRELMVRTETVVIELRRETMVIETRPGGPAVYFGEELLQPGESRELLLYDEQAVISKVPFVSEEVHVGKRSVTETHRRDVELNYEVLVVEQQPGEEEPQKPV